MSTMDDPHMNVEFYDNHSLDELATERAGEPVYRKGQVYVRAQPKADHLTVFNQPAKTEHFKRWPKAYNRYLQGKNVDGTAISILPSLSDSQVAKFFNAGIRTVEQLAQMPDRELIALSIAGAQRARIDAQQYLELARLRERERERAKAEADEARSAPKRGPGRPRKDDAAEVEAAA